MGKRRDRKKQPRVVTNPESVTPWFNNGRVFEPKATKDRRGESEFFSEFTTESLFAAAQGPDAAIDPYAVLGLFPGATLEQVKRAHRTMVKKYHPDRFASASKVEMSNAEARMIQVNAAYAELLSRIETSGG